MTTRTGFEAAGHNRDPRALRREAPGDRRADAPTRSGDDRNPVGQCIAHGGWTIVAWCLPVVSSIVFRRGTRRRGTRPALEVGPDLDDRDLRNVSAMSSPTCSNRHDTTTERAEVAAIADAYNSLSDLGKVRFLTLLPRDFWTDPAHGRSGDRGSQRRRGRTR